MGKYVNVRCRQFIVVRKSVVDAQSPDDDLTGHSFPDRNSHDNRATNCIEKTWGKEPYGYQWPASRLSRYEMARLTIVSNQVKRPLNQLIKEAVDAYATKLLHELGYRELDDLILMPPVRDSLRDQRC